MNNVLIFGGSSGLGFEIARIFQESKKFEPIICSRNYPDPKYKTISIKHEECDLAKFTKNCFLNLFNKYDSISSLCFSQRFRNDNKTNLDEFHIEEYKVMVLSISKAIEAFKIYKNNLSINKNNNFTRILVIGSVYSESIGLDQDYNYHACKFAQLGLIRYFALQSKATFNINMLSPATYIKEGAEKYWKDHPKSELWDNFPMKRLAKVNDIAKEAFGILTTSSEFLNGNNLIVDSGVINLYNDQTFN